MKMIRMITKRDLPSRSSPRSLPSASQLPQQAPPAVRSRRPSIGTTTSGQISVPSGRSSRPRPRR
jgi:hypothetical protein